MNTIAHSSGRASKPKAPRTRHFHCLLKVPDVLLFGCTPILAFLFGSTLHNVASKSSRHQPWPHSERCTYGLVLRPDLRHKLDNIHILVCCPRLLLGGLLTFRRWVHHREARDEVQQLGKMRFCSRSTLLSIGSSAVMSDER